MKIRSGFVANSSSYSSIIGIGNIRAEHIEAFENFLSHFIDVIDISDDIYTIIKISDIIKNEEGDQEDFRLKEYLFIEDNKIYFKYGEDKVCSYLSENMKKNDYIIVVFGSVFSSASNSDRLEDYLNMLKIIQNHRLVNGGESIIRIGHD